MENEKEFKNWVMNEVISQINKTGGYIPIYKGITDHEIIQNAIDIANNIIMKRKSNI